MAEIIDDLPGGAKTHRYPWDEWLDGKARKLTRGIDFDVSVTTFRANAYGAATRLGVKVSVLTDKSDEDVLYIQVRKIEANGQPGN